MGGVGTVVARAAVFGYLLIQCLSVLNQDYTLQTSFIKRDLRMDNTIIELSDDNFDLAFKIDYILAGTEPDVENNIDQYLALSLT